MITGCHFWLRTFFRPPPPLLSGPPPPPTPSFFTPFQVFYPQKIAPQKIKILQNWKKHLLHMYTKNYNWMMYGSLDMVHNMDRQKKWLIEVGAPPKNWLLKRIFFCISFSIWLNHYQCKLQIVSCDKKTLFKQKTSAFLKG